MNLSIRKKILYSLFALTVVLLLGNIIVDLVLGPEKVTSEEIIDNNFSGFFDKTLSDYGVSKNSIKLTKEIKDDTTYYKYKVAVALTFPVALFVNDIRNVKTDEPVSFTCIENKMGVLTRVILRGAHKVIDAEITVSKDVTREGDTLIIFADCRSLNEEELTKYVKDVTVNFSVLLKPSVETRATALKLSNMGKRYHLVFDDEIQDLKYKLEAGYSQRRIFEVMNNLNVDFPEAVYYYIGDTPELNTVPINKEAVKFNKSVLNNIGVKIIKDENELDFLFKSAGKYKTYFLVIEPDLLKDTEGMFFKLVKRGDKILN